MRKVLPRADRAAPALASRVQQILFDQVARRALPRPPRREWPHGEFYGIHEANDPANRLLVVVDFAQQLRGDVALVVSCSPQ